MANEIKKYIGKRLPGLGTPLTISSFKDDEAKKQREYEVHIFIDGIVKFYRNLVLVSEYDHIDAKDLEGYIKTSDQIVNDEIEKIILEQMDDSGIPRQRYLQPDPVTEDVFMPFLQSLWTRGNYDSEFGNISRNSGFGTLRLEFSEIMKLPKMKVRISAGV